MLFTSLRKAGSLVLSYTLFPKPITLQHLVGGSLILFGMYLNDKVGAGGNLLNQQPQVLPRIEQRWVFLSAVRPGQSAVQVVPRMEQRWVFVGCCLVRGQRTLLGCPSSAPGPTPRCLSIMLAAPLSCVSPRR